MLKDRIILTYPDNPSKNNDMAVLQAATDEWIRQYYKWYDKLIASHDKILNVIEKQQAGATLDITSYSKVIAPY